eukprot:scaffold46994_cov40-Cyclotella_meneghiniana.AAC.4
MDRPISFKRRLKRWSFTRIAVFGPMRPAKLDELCAYYHPNFIRDDPSRPKTIATPLTDYDTNTPSESNHQSRATATEEIVTLEQPPSTGEDDSAISPEEAGFRRMAWLALAPLYRDTSLMPTILDVASDNNNVNVHDISKDSNSSNVDGADEEDVTFTGVKRRADTHYQNEDYAKPAAKRARNSNYDTKMNSGQQKKESSIVQEDDHDVSLPDWYEADDSEKQLLDEFQNEYLSKLEAIKYPYAMKEDSYWQERASSDKDDDSLPDWYESDKDDDDYSLPDWYESSKSEEEQLSALAAKVSVTNEYDDIMLTTKSQEESCDDSLPDWYAAEPMNDSNPTKQDTNQQDQYLLTKRRNNLRLFAGSADNLSYANSITDAQLCGLYENEFARRRAARGLDIGTQEQRDIDYMFPSSSRVRKREGLVASIGSPTNDGKPLERDPNKILYEWYAAHKELFPFPSKKEKKELVLVTGLTEKQVTEFFQRARSEASIGQVKKWRKINRLRQSYSAHKSISKRALASVGLTEEQISKLSEMRTSDHPQFAVDHLREWYSAHISFPFPSRKEKGELALKTGLTKKQVCMWFCSARLKTGLNRDAIYRLMEWYSSHESNPYPSDEEMKELTLSTGLTSKQVREWFDTYNRSRAGFETRKQVDMWFADERRKLKSGIF